MFIIYLIEIFAKAILLGLLLHLLARHEADYELLKVAVVVAILTVLTLLLEVTLQPWIGYWTLIPVALLTACMLWKFCWVRFWKAAVITVPFLVITGLAGWKVAQYKAQFDRGMTHMATMGAMPKKEQDDLMKWMKESLGAAGSAAMPAGGMRLNTPSAVTSNAPAPEPRSPTNTEILAVPSNTLSIPATATASATPLVLAATATPLPAAPPVATTQAAPASSTPLPAGADWAGARSKLKVTATAALPGGKQVVNVNGQPLEAGEIIAVEHDGAKYRWKLKAITPKGPEWQALEAR